MIARTNLSRPNVDVGYLSGLSDDAIPTLIDRLPRLSPPLRRALARRLLSSPLPPPNWRAWNLDRERARASLVAHHHELVQYAR